MAKKRYYQSKKDRMDESRGMKKRAARKRKDSMDERKGMERRLGEEFYAGMHGRSAADRRASGMISEDRSAIANLPQNVIMREYPRVDYARQEGLNDNILGIDVQMYDDARHKKGKKYPQKY